MADCDGDAAAADNDGLALDALLDSPVSFSAFASPHFSLGRSTDVRVKRTVCYIVAGLLFRTNADGHLEVLLMQEAKEGCAGQWYMPAGRVEPDESIEAATAREVLEETGIECVVTDLAAFEAQGGGWYRFSFLCRAVGGSLKTTPDAESLCAQWFELNALDKLQMRAKDARQVIRWAAARQTALETGACRHSPAIVAAPVPSMFIRLVLVEKSVGADANSYRCLVSRGDRDGNQASELPIVEYSLNAFVAAVISKFFRELVEEGAAVLQIPSRCLCVQSAPADGRHQGLCLTLLVTVKPRMALRVKRPERYELKRISSAAVVRLLDQADEHAARFDMR